MASYDYREYCPIAKAAQILGERWTLLILRELMLGTTRFNQLRRFLPRLSPTLLRKRLRTLEDEGLVARVRSRDGDGHEYVLTSSGEALQAALLELGRWSVQWQYDKFKDEPVLVDALMRDVETLLVPAALPGRRSVLRFLFDDAGDAHWHVIVDGDHVEACDEDRGFDVDVYLSTTARVLSDIFIARTTLAEAMADGRLRVTGSATHVRSIDRWFPTSPFAAA